MSLLLFCWGFRDFFRLCEKKVKKGLLIKSMCVLYAAWFETKQAEKPVENGQEIVLKKSSKFGLQCKRKCVGWPALFETNNGCYEQWISSENLF